MGLDKSILHHASFARCLDRGTRWEHGVKTAEETREMWARGEEKKLQSLIANFLNMRDIYFEIDRMDRKTSGKVGRPDFRICYRGCWLAIECKAEGGKLSKEQAATLEKIRKNGGVAIVAFGLPAVQEALRNIDQTEGRANQ